MNIPQDGFYQLGFDYYALEGKRSSLLRSVQVDGKYPFMQSKKLEFMRMWKEAGPVIVDNQGNEYNPKQEEVQGWQNSVFSDPEAKVLEPLRYHLTQGEHTIRIGVIREPSAIGTLRVFSPEQIPTYQELEAEYKTKGYKAGDEAAHQDSSRGHDAEVQSDAAETGKQRSGNRAVQ